MTTHTLLVLVGAGWTPLLAPGAPDGFEVSKSGGIFCAVNGGDVEALYPVQFPNDGATYTVTDISVTYRALADDGILRAALLRVDDAYLGSMSQAVTGTSTPDLTGYATGSGNLTWASHLSTPHVVDPADYYTLWVQIDDVATRQNVRPVAFELTYTRQ